MKDALLNRTDSNVILVDWSRGARDGGSLLEFPQASGNAQLVGAQTAELIKFLISNAPGSSGSTDLGKRFYIVGFSLGAHVAGYAGNGGISLGRITGNAMKRGSEINNPFSNSCQRTFPLLLNLWPVPRFKSHFHHQSKFMIIYRNRQLITLQLNEKMRGVSI